MQIATLVGSVRLSPGDVAAASNAVAAEGGVPGAIVWLDKDKAAEFTLNGAARRMRDVIEAAVPHADIFVQDQNARVRRLFVADMDSTMITVECIDELADYAGLKPEISAVTEAAMRGEIDFAEALQRRVALLEGLSTSAIEDCLDQRVRLSAGARTLVRSLRAAGVHTLLVSGGFTRFTGPVAAEIGFDETLANVLEEKDGILTGRVIPPIVDASAKARALETAATKFGVSANAAIAIGDGANDLLMVEAAGLGVAYHAKPQLAEAADARIRNGDLTALLYALGIPRSNWIE